MKLLWQTAHAAWRLSLQTGSDDGYYPGPTYRFAHGSKRERAAINRAIEILRAPDDKMKNRAPGRILNKLEAKNRHRHSVWGPFSAYQLNCRCVVSAIEGATFFGSNDENQRKLTGLIGPADATGHDLEPITVGVPSLRSEQLEAALAAHRDLVKDLPDGTPFVWQPVQDKTIHKLYKPGESDEAPKAEE